MDSAEPTASPIVVRYPDDLPITERRDELLAAIGDNQVVVVAGETGSGKSTQLPKMCLELGLHEQGWIGHTQPRRIAARSIAERVAEELDDEVGGLVGYKVRFTDKVSKKTAIKAMTDGILLAEMQHDRNLDAYSTIIVDEAHERSLNIDFLLGYLRQLLPKRPDLKIIITSATIDTERFSQHFDDAPIIEVSGRTYPVEVRYHPIEDEVTGLSLTQAEAIVEAVNELELEGPGDVLVFCSGEREIREATDALAEARLRNTEVVPLYGRLSAAEQHRVFDRSRRSARRIVVATNVAETSLTVPGIRYVVDPGTARISRYSNRTKVQRLPIEDVSQASANQRSGRCGRVAPGIAIRLYSEANFANRPEFTEPEITRTNLASVILQMAALGLGDIETFPFVDPPELRNIRDGVALLEELDAVRPGREGTRKWLTPIGRKLARMPIDPRFGRMVIAGAEDGCLREVMIITAAMSVRDPRERPREKQAQAAQFHERFDEPGSDFVSWLNLWSYLEAERKGRSNSSFRRMVGKEFLNYNRIREWWDIVRQLERTAKSLRWPVNDFDPERLESAAIRDNIHRCLLTGLLSHIGLKDANGSEFTGGRNARFVIGRSSVLGKKPPNWVMAGELIETNRLWAHSAARIQPEWAEQAGEHLIKRTYEEPQWDAEKGSAMTIERATLYGVPLVAGRRVHYRRVDPTVARELFIHHALIEGDWQTDHAFFAQNEGVLDEVRRLGARQRQDLFVEYDVLYDFYDQRVGDKVTSGADFDRWWNKRRQREPRLLDLRLEEIFDTSRLDVDDDFFPEVWSAGDLELAVDYEFDQSAPNDGVTVTVPVSLLSRIDPAVFDWNVPGLREELVTALLRSIPKQLRKAFVPIPDTVQRILPNLSHPTGDLVEAVRRELRVLSPAPLPADAIVLDRLPSHLRPIYRVVNDDGDLLAHGRDLGSIRAQLSAEVTRVLAGGHHELVRSGETRWVFGDLPRRIRTVAAGRDVDAFPGLVDEGDTVGVRLHPTPDAQYESMWSGTRRLVRLNVGGSARMLDDLLDREATLALATSPHGSKVAWVHDAADCIFGHLLERGGGVVWNEADFDRLVAEVRSALPDAVEKLGRRAVQILVTAAELRHDLSRPVPKRLHPAYLDMQAQLDRLIYPDHLSGVGAHRLADVVRYLAGMRVRLDKLPNRVTKDEQLMTRCRNLENEFDAYAEQLPPSTELEDLNWQLEEFRIATFAQQVGTTGKVSSERIRARLREL
ncbi:MAG: ATP-dependent RNA helicase HrpA [Acidimicrobiales bacterium]|nr:ATP-dependent RNA helicase HrpA [Acidimicrobiales bacterium]